MKLQIALLSIVSALVVACLPESNDEAQPNLLVNRESASLNFSHPKADCQECHAQHVAEWEISNHAYAAKDPVFHAMLKVGQASTEGKIGQFCVQCHAPVGMAAGQTEVIFDEDQGIFQQPLDGLDEVASHGVSCDVCHSITEVIEPKNARMALTPNGVKLGGIKDPVPTEAHASEYSPLHKESEVCGSCHAVTTPRGALAEETFGEWEMSEAAANGKTCQSCHMPVYRGKAAPGAPERELHRHTFVGVDVSLLPPEEFPGYEEMREMTRTLLRESARIETQYNQAKSEIEVAVTNLSGHALPTGATAERQLWGELIVRDADNNIVFESGTLDRHGDIRDNISYHSEAPGTDPQLLYHGQFLIEDQTLKSISDEVLAVARKLELDLACNDIIQANEDAPEEVAVVTFPWQANWQCNTMIAPDATSRHQYDLSDLVAGKYTATFRLLFRTFPPYFLRKLEAQGGLDPEVKTRVPTVEVAASKIELLIP